MHAGRTVALLREWGKWKKEQEDALILIFNFPCSDCPWVSYLI